MNTSRQKTEKAIYMERITRLQSDGLRDVKFYATPKIDASEEDVYEVLNRLLAAQDLPDTEVLGAYSSGSKT